QPTNPAADRSSATWIASSIFSYIGVLSRALASGYVPALAPVGAQPTLLSELLCALCGTQWRQLGRGALRRWDRYTTPLGHHGELRQGTFLGLGGHWYLSLDENGGRGIQPRLRLAAS